VPTRNSDYWVPKLRRNVQRDREVDGALAAEGWKVVRVWEHDDLEEAASRIASLVKELSLQRSG
jgi:DNA mismatch endonuclease (patch repair protein)